MRARWIERWGGPLEAGERADPSPTSGELLIKVEACGVGLTVLNYIRGDLSRGDGDLPRIPGHEVVGVVVDTGPDASQDWIGQRVTVFFYLFCGRCHECRRGRESLCRGLEGYVGVQRDGGYAELMTVPERNAVRLPSALDPAQATVIPDAVATPVHVARRAGILGGERVAVIAAGGGVGVHMLQVALLHGARVAALEAAQSKLARLDDEFDVTAVDSSDFSEVKLPRDWNGHVDVVVDLLGTSDSSAWAARRLDRGGRLVLLTTFRNVEFTLSHRDAVLGEITVLGSRYASPAELHIAAEYVESGRVRPVIGEVTSWTEVDSIHDGLRNGSLWGRGALDWAAVSAGGPSGIRHNV